MADTQAARGITTQGDGDTGSGSRRAIGPPDAVPVEFAGWLPVFRCFGNCGHHPQFAHTRNPPPGYRFVSSAHPASERASPVGLAGWAARAARVLFKAFEPLAALVRNSVELGPVPCLAALAALARLGYRLLAAGARPIPVLRFLHTRHFRSQAMLPRGDGLVFLTSVPYTYGQRPWVIEIEDATTLFFPFLQNGRTRLVDLARSPYLRIVRTLLEDDSCRGIITHVRSTARTLPTLFGSEVIARKVSYCPLGVRVPEHGQTHEDDGPLELLFTNSWHQGPEGFYLRGGLDVLEAFAVLKERYPDLRLTLRTCLPSNLKERYHRIVEKGWVRVINRFLPGDELDLLMRQAHVYLLPAARVHIVSVLQAMSYGHAVVVSDGWGIQEYVTHNRNGLVVPGRYGRVSWIDEQAGLLREDYRPMFRPDAAVVAGLVEAVGRLVEDREERRRLGRTARADVAAVYNLGQWNEGLRAAFDRARAGRPGGNDHA